jgi:hypothetical protein
MLSIRTRACTRPQLWVRATETGPLQPLVRLTASSRCILVGGCISCSVSEVKGVGGHRSRVRVQGQTDSPSLNIRLIPPLDHNSINMMSC